MTISNAVAKIKKNKAGAVGIAAVAVGFAAISLLVHIVRGKK